MIVPMKKAQIVVLKEDYERVIKSLQRFGVIMIINKEGGEASPSLELNEALQQRVEKTIRLAKKIEKKKSGFGQYQVVEYNDFATVKENTVQKVNEIETTQVIIHDLKQNIKELEESKSTFEAWKDLDLSASELKPTKYTRTYLGYILPRYQELFETEMKEKNYLHQVFEANKHGLAVFVNCYYEDEEEVLDFLKKVDFVQFNYPDTSLTIQQYVEELKQEIETKKVALQEHDEKLKQFVADIDEFKVLSDQILSQEAINNIRYQTTVETSYIEGWVRSDKLNVLEQAIHEATEYYDVEYVDPSEGETAPTYTKNNPFASQFETITDMFSKPSNKEIDPNPVMSIWYWLLFGMMMGDAGYGLLMILICLLLKKIMRPKGNTLKLINIIMYSGVPTIFWGIIFGSYFGFNPAVDWGWTFVWYWFNPMENPILMLILSVAIGALHLITGLIIKAIANVREKNIIEMLSKNLSWILILSGIGVFFIHKMVGMIMVIIGVLLILLFAGANKKSIIGKAAFGLLGLYDATSYMSDLLSYSRIMALAMSSASVAVVMNTLAQMVGGSVVGMFFAAIIFLVGHLFNLVLGLLSAYVHDSRLQYIEFFGKFYEGGGIDFKPLSLKTKYVNEIKE